MSERNAPIKVAINRLKLIKLTVICLVFVAMAVLFLVKPHWFDAHRLMVRGIGVVALGFFGLCFVVLIKVWRHQGAYLIIDDKGIVDNSVNGLGRIWWQDIERIWTTYEYGTPLILLGVVNPNQYIANAPKWRQWLYRYNNGRCGTPVVISAVVLDMGAVELYELLRRYRP